MSQTRIAIWNLEQAQPSSPAGQTQARVTAEAKADIWIATTEAPAEIPLSGFDTNDSAPMLSGTAALFTTIAAGV